MSISTQKPLNSSYPAEYTHIGHYLRKVRLEKGLHQKDIAVLFGVSETIIGLWEQGKSNPRIQHLGNVISFIGYDPYAKTDDSLESRVWNYRRKHGLSVKLFAQMVGVEASFMGRILSGKYMGSDETRKRIASVIS